MGRDTRDRMVRAGAALFRDRGYRGTGLRDVVAYAHAPRGSIYHHFPRGKSQLAEDVLGWAGQALTDRFDAIVFDDPAVAVDEFVHLVRSTLLAGPLRAGCPVAAITLGADTDDEHLVSLAARTFRQWEAGLTASLRRAGVARQRATDLATLAVAAMEGALILCRAENSDQPLRRVARELRETVHHAVDAGRG